MGRSAVLSAVLGKGGKLALPRVARATPPVLAWGVARWKQAAIADPQRCRDINALPGIKASQIADAR
jgi:hypothetical protein